MAEENDTQTNRPIGIKPIVIQPNPASGNAPISASTTTPTIHLKAPTDPSIAAVTPTQHFMPNVVSTTNRMTPPKMQNGENLSLANAAQTPTSARLKPAVSAPIGSAATNPTKSMPRVVQQNNVEAAEKPTMRIKPTAMKPAPISSGTTAQIKFESAPEKPNLSPIAAAAEKGKTSRISLDSAINTTADSNAAPMGKITSHLPDDLAAPTAKSSTVRLNVPSDEVTNTQQVTRKRTLRVKAPTRTAAPATPADAAATPSEEVSSEAVTVKKKGLTIKKTSEASTAETPSTSSIPGVEDDMIPAFAHTQQKVVVEKTNVIFPILSALAAIITLVMIFLFASEACGPDRSLTKFSSFPDAISIDWPGKIQN